MSNNKESCHVIWGVEVFHLVYHCHYIICHALHISLYDINNNQMVN